MGRHGYDSDMAPISTKLHGVGDVAGAALALSAPRLLPIRDRRAQALALLAGGGMIVNGALTDYELGLRRRLPMPTHLLIDAVGGGLLLAGAEALRRANRTHVADWLPHLALGVSQITGAALTERQPRGSATQRSGSAAPQRAQTPRPPSAPPPSASAPIAPPRLGTPGPSVNAPASPESETARRERINSGLAGAGSPQTGDTLVAQEEAAAAAEAGAIGGIVAPDSEDPALDPVYQAGGGPQDGWDAVEEELIENATHGDGHGQPERDAISPELESDRSTAVYGESDHIAATEVVEDPEAPRDDPGAGPGLAADRG